MTPFYGSAKTGNPNVVFFRTYMHPHANKNHETVLRVVLLHNRDLAILRHPKPFYGVERSLLLGWLVYDHGLHPVNLDHIFVVIFMRSQSCRLGCIWICVPAVCLAPKKLGLQSSPPRKLTSRTSTLRPKSGVPNKTHVCAGIGQYSYNLP